MRKRNNEKGTVMLEGVIVMIFTIFILIWILAVGFLYYQRYLLTATTNDAAVKIASTYNNPSSDIIMGYASTDEISKRDLYRETKSSNLTKVNQKKATAYIKYMLNKTNFAGTIKDVTVKMELVRDSDVRKHIEIYSECTFNTPFGNALSFFGMDASVKYSSTSRADCTDVINYFSTIDAVSAIDSIGNSSKIKGFADSVVKLISSIMEFYNHNYTEE